MDHIVFVPLSIVSHTRSELNFAWNLLRLHATLKITWITTSYGLPTLERELTLRDDSTDGANGRWRVVELKDDLPRSNASFEDQGVIANGFKPAFRQIVADHIPCLVIFDLARPTILSSIQDVCIERAIPRIPAFAMMPTIACTAFRFIVPSNDGGVLEDIVTNRDEYISQGMTRCDASMRAWRHVEGKLLQMPGLPPLYDYEISPQSGARSAPPDCDALNQMYRNAQGADGTIWLSTPELEGPILEELGRRLGGPAIGVGCQLFDHRETSAADEDIFSFLATQRALHGPSFGTLFWPNDRPDILDVIIGVLLTVEPPLPFLFATPFADRISPELLHQVSKSGRGLFVEWAPQRQVLEHPAVGMFLCHCGIGAIMEAIFSLTPFVGLPFGSEQPLNAAFYTRTHQIGVQLHQFASNMDGLPLGCGGIVQGTPEAMERELNCALTTVRGHSGSVLRKNMEEMRATMQRSAQRGQSLSEMLRFSRFFAQSKPIPREANSSVAVRVA